MYIGIDIGTSSLKAAVIIGEKLSFHNAAYPSGTHRGCSHDPGLVRKAMESLLAEITSTYRSGIAGLRGIGMSGHGPSALIAGSDGKALSELLTWQDSSALTEERAIQSSFEGFDKGGSSYEGKAARFYRLYPGLFKPGVKVLYPKDYISSLLTGRMSTDRSTASTIVFWNDEQQIWNPGTSGMPADIFPEVIEPWDVSGTTGTAWSRSCGLPDGVPVYGGGIDAYSELLGVGAVRPGSLVDGTGTSTCISMVSSTPEGTEEGRSASGQAPLPHLDRHLLPKLWLRMATMSYTGGSVQWMQDILGTPMAAAMDGVKAGPVPLLFLPYLIGERSPIWDAAASGVFAGLGKDTGRHELLAGILQGCAFGVRQNLEQLRGQGPAGKSGAGDIMAVGGGACNDVWLQMKADITGLRYQRPAHPEAAPLGAAMLAAFGRERSDPVELSERYVQVERSFEPSCDGKCRDTYHKLYGMYLDLYAKLRDTLHSLAELKNSPDSRAGTDRSEDAPNRNGGFPV
jgi:xylulokinase